VFLRKNNIKIIDLEYNTQCCLVKIYSKKKNSIRETVQNRKTSRVF